MKMWAKLQQRCTRILAPIVLLGSCTVGGFEGHLRLAEGYFVQGQYQKALDEYSKIINAPVRGPVAIRAVMQAAKIYEENLKQYERAIKTYREISKKTDDERWLLDARTAAARIFQDRMDLPLEAAREYRTLLKDFGQDHMLAPTWSFRMGKALANAGSFDEAAQIFESFPKRFPDSQERPRARLEEANARLANRDFERAAAAFRTFLELDSRGAGVLSSWLGEAYYGLGSSLEALGESKSALEAYRQSLALYPNPKVIQLKIERVEMREKNRGL